MYDPDELPPPPTLSAETFQQLQETLLRAGPVQAIDQLCADLRKLGDLNAVFYAMLMKKRVELGVSPFPTGSSADLPAQSHDAYESAIREAGRLVGGEYLRLHDLRKAWFFYNMLGETEPVKKYIEEFVPTDGDDVQPIIEIGLYQRVNPARGFDLVVERYGICNAITTYSGQDFSGIPEAKQHCIRALVRSLYAQLLERLKNDLETRGVGVPADQTVGRIVAGHPELFADGGYHVDTSHLSSIVQFCLELDACPERALARELCAYGEQLGTAFRYESDPPFEKNYTDFRILLETIDGIDTEAGLEHFRQKIEPAASLGMTFPAEVFVNILLRLDRTQEALDVAVQYLANETRQLSCPSVYELCQQSGDFRRLAETAQKRGDGVNFLASLIAKR